MERAALAARLGAPRVNRARSRYPEPVLVSEPDPELFMAAFTAAVAGDTEVFLCDPQWGEQEHEQLEQLLPKAYNSRSPFPSARGWLMIPTGGTSGQMKFTRHDADTIEAAVQGFIGHFGLHHINAVGVLPLHHVSGLMARLRCTLSGGDYRHWDWKQLERGSWPELPAKPDGWVISLVPTQLERLLRSPAAIARLQRFRIIFLGGAPAWPELLDRAAAARLPLSVGYGMTETAAMVTALLPDEFLGGARDNGRALPHARVSVSTEGVVMLESTSLFRGYYPYWEGETAFATGDLGRVDKRGHLTILGRRDGVIISGGEKIQPAEVEAVLRGRGGFRDVVVVGLPDAEWGQAVVAVFPAREKPDLIWIEREVQELLAPYKRPKRYVALAEWPVTAAGKVNRNEVIRLLGGQRNH